MISLRRSSSASSCSSTSGGSTTCSSGVPHTRRRVSPSQQQALNILYSNKPHPSREERAILADEIGMELKAVNTWFQNKRQTSKRRANRNENLPPNNNLHPHIRSSSCKPLGATISLDHIAKLSERPSEYSSASRPRLPLSPGINPLEYSDNNSELWRLMPSSPITSPSSPTLDKSRFSVLPIQSKSMRSLEWACAKARVTDKMGEPDDFLPPTPEENVFTTYVPDTDVEEEEAITPNSSFEISTITVCNGPMKKDGIVTDDGRPFEDVEAAMVLLRFMGRR